MARGSSGAISIGLSVALVAGVGLAVTSQPAAARADAPAPTETDWWVSPGFADIRGSHVTTLTPILGVSQEEPEVASGIYPTYSVEFVIEEEGAPPSAVESVVVPATRSQGWEQYWEATWSIEEGTLEPDSAYQVRYRVSSATDVGQWSDWLALFTVTLPGAPELIAPADGAVLTQWPELVVDVSVGETPLPATVFFRVETSWENGAPWVVDEGWVTADEQGEARFAPSSYGEYYGSFRWQASYDIGYGGSEWTEFETFEWAPPPPTPWGLLAYQTPHEIKIAWESRYWFDDYPVLDHTISISPGNIVATVDADTLELQIDELPFGVYTVSAVSRTALGTSQPSTVELVVGETVPWAPTNMEVVVDGTSATISWDPPDSDGGSPVTGYMLRGFGWPYEGGASVPLSDVETVSTSATLTGLTPGTRYIVLLSALNTLGETIAEDVSVLEFVAYGAPSAPLNPEVRPGTDGLYLYWDTPQFENGRPATSFEVTANPGGITRTFYSPMGMWGFRASAFFGGLTNGTEYTFEIAATNLGGTGPSVETPAMTPEPDSADTDTDGLPDVVEEHVGSDPLLVDTDADSLTDFQEIQFLAAFTSVASADTDEDGTTDDGEDSDGDLLSNLVELSAGLNPASPDTDGDGIKDSVEVTSPSDPLLPDTDGDGLTDGFEVEAGLDPAMADSDSDSVEDADSVVELTVSVTEEVREESGYVTVPYVSADVVGVADALTEVSLSAASAGTLPGAVTASALVVDSVRTDDVVANVGTPTSSAPIVTAVTFHLKESVLAARLNELAPVRWNEASAVWEFVDNDVSVSTAEHTVSILSPTLGLRYAVVDLGEWRASATQCDAAAAGRAPLDVEVILDGTKSVWDIDPTRERYAAVAAVLESLRPGDRVSVREFDWVFDDYGFGGRYDESPGTWIWNDRAVSEGATSRELALAFLDRRMTEPSPASWEEYPWEDDPGTEWFAERVLGTPRDSDPFADPENPFVDAADDACRQKTVLLLTDGDFEPALDYVPGPDDWPPLPDGYVSFLQRTVPVHILDVGLGTDVGWMEGLASRTGGSYSYVPTAIDLAAWIDDVVPPDTTNWDAVTDSDDDGIPNFVEVQGVTSTMGMKGPGGLNRYFSDPFDEDSDNDGLLDGEEIGTRLSAADLGQPWQSSRPITAYAVISNPEKPDSDSDGIVDVDEIEFGLFPLHHDSDGDGVRDGLEELYGTDPFLPDSDQDGFSDLFEVENGGDGYDPVEFNTRISKLQWLEDFYLGAFCGDFKVCQRASIPWLIGSVASGALVYGDLRDIIANGYEGDWVASVLCAAAIVPLVGDSVGLGAKITRLFAHLAPAEKSAALQLLWRLSGDANAFVSKLDELAPILANKLDNLNVPAANIVRLVNANGVDRLQRLLTSSAVQVFPNPNTVATFMATGRKGEQHLIALLSLGSDYRQGQRVAGATGSGWSSGARRPDAMITIGDDLWFHEAKVGYVSGWFAKRQIARENWLLDHNVIAGSQWHLFASAMTDKIGPSEPVLQFLENSGVTVFVHVPLL